MEEQLYKNWQLSTDENNILWLGLDRADTSVNTLNREVLEELDQILDSLIQGKLTPTALIIKSGKANGFIAGADIAQFSQLNDVNEAFALVRKGQMIYDKLDALSITTVAMIDGFCMGGGTEMALACDYRVAEESQKTRIALPEILLGIHPGWGGSVRLVRLIGPAKAMDIMLSGRGLSARAAAKSGVIDVAVPKRQLARAACFYAQNKPSRKPLSKISSLTNLSFVRPLLGHFLRRLVETREAPRNPLHQLKIAFDWRMEKKVTPEQYPAPFALIDLWVEDGAKGEKAYINEAQSVGKLFFTDTSKNLVRLFHLQERLKNMAKAVEFNPQHVHVIGAGTMGGDIAAWCALRGLTVTLQDREPKLLSNAIKRANRLFHDRLKIDREAQAAMDRLIPDVDGVGIAKADVIIEAIYENLEAKQALFADLEKRAKPTALLATNTSSIPLDEITDSPRLVGIHFFNPVAKMHLVEVVRGEKTDSNVFNQAMAFVRRIDRLPLPVKSSPGFLVNRILMPYLNEAMRMIDEGISMTAIDKAAVQFGMPMGPIELADTVGLDVCFSVAKNLSSHFGGTIPVRLQQMVEAGKLGRKTNVGFYVYKNGKAVKPALPKTPVDFSQLSDRMIGKMLEESDKCLKEDVVADVDLLDAGMIFGTGFAPFRGGPMQYQRYLKSATPVVVSVTVEAAETKHESKHKVSDSAMESSQE
ncbi:MAG: crotonase [Legionellales bacterium]|nr:crotonase [Legionellales bacterium]